MSLRIALALAALASAACSAADESPRGPARNVVLVSIDSLRADHLGCYGYERDTSPEIDRLAREGVRCAQVVAETSWTLPAHATLLTGLSSLAHGVLDDGAALAPAHTTVAELLREQGFRTFGVWSGPYLHPAFGLAQGFEVWEGVGRSGAPLDAPDFDPTAGGEDARKAINHANRASHASVTSPQVLERSLALLDQVKDERFFLFVHFFDVHYDYVPPEAHWRRFDPDYDGPHTGERFLTDPELVPGLDARLLEHVIARYDGEIHFVDLHVGRLARELERRGLARDTLFVVTSDHGDEFFEHGGKGHMRTLYDEVLLVPLVAWRPGALAAGHIVKSQVRHVDVAPTLLEALGVPVPPDWPGASASAAFAGGPDPAPVEALSRLWDPDAGHGSWRSLRRPGAKVIVRTDRRNVDELFLYDLARDPGERVVEDVLSKRGKTMLGDLSELEAAERELATALAAGRARANPPEDVKSDLGELGYTE